MASKDTAPILTQIQNELKAPKNQRNNFGKYDYRSAEDIEQALKPLLLKYMASIYITEDVKQVGDRIYFVETVKYKDAETELEVKGWAREAQSKKGMDDSQLSGATSSYAIKYALAKLFLIDDTKDVDGQVPASQVNTARRAPATRNQPAKRTFTKAQLMNYRLEGQSHPLIDVVRGAFLEKNKKCDDYIKALTGEPREVAMAIYKQGLYKTGVK